MNNCVYGLLLEHNSENITYIGQYRQMITYVQCTWMCNLQSKNLYTGMYNMGSYCAAGTICCYLSVRLDQLLSVLVQCGKFYSSN